MRIPLRSICFRNPSTLSGRKACSMAACSLAYSCVFSTLMAACSKTMFYTCGAGASPAHLKSLERETGIEPATNSLEGCDSTTELLPRNPAVSFQLSAFSEPSQLRTRNSQLDGAVDQD